MSLTLAATRIGPTVQVTATSDLGDDAVYYWYVDGQFAAMTRSPQRSFWMPTGEQVRVGCIDSTDDTLDGVAIGPAAHPSTRTLWWLRSLEDTEFYRVQWSIDGADWETVGTVVADGRWAYSWHSRRLDDLTEYAWRVLPVDAGGNEGTAVELGAELIVRTPDAPRFSVTFDEGTSRATIDDTS